VSASAGRTAPRLESGVRRHVARRREHDARQPRGKTGALTLADLNVDGTREIVYGTTVLRANSTVKLRMSLPATPPATRLPLVVRKGAPCRTCGS